MKKLAVLLLLVPCLALAGGKVKNVILMIGDGMGLSQLSTAYYFNGNQSPNFSRFPVVGLINTSSAKQKVTDSAAGATAFACGARSYNGAISMDLQGKKLATIIEEIESKKIKSGVVATSSITHATPACFYAHAEYRKQEEEIATYLPQSGVDFFAAGGLDFFTKRADNANVYQQLVEAGFIMDSTALTPNTIYDAAKKYGYLLAPKGMPSKLDGRKDFLPNATQAAIDYLSESKKGFFLMVEGSQIDWEGHAKNSDGIIEEVKDFDKAIGVALDFAEKNGNTLVVVTADHETGGYALTPTMVDGKPNYENIAPSFYEGAQHLRSASHTATLIPVLAYGPKSANFAGIYDNNEIFHKIRKVAKW